jgi:4-alpha-glucanotransferase
VIKGESSFGGNPWLISPSRLIEYNVLSSDDLNSIDRSKFNDEFVNFKDVKLFKDNLMKKSFENFKNNFPNYKKILNEFFQNEIYWIEDFILFMTIKDKVTTERFFDIFICLIQYEGVSWCDWPESLRRRHQSALDSIRQNEKDRLEYHLFVQYIFDKQWKQLKQYANDKNIKIIGDMPMYVDYHSVDVWANSHLFKLDSNTIKPTVVSGILVLFMKI